MSINFGEKKGFTLVELIIVIAVIGILAAISFVAYSKAQQGARDAARKSDVAQIVKLLTTYEADKGVSMFTGSGCGSAGNGSGWFNFSNGGTYPISMNDCLKNAGYTYSDIVDPSKAKTCTGLTCHAYMKYTCNAGADTYVYANLETLPQTSTDTDGTCAATVDTSQGMNYFVKVNIN